MRSSAQQESSPTKIVLGFDPGALRTGYAVVAYGDGGFSLLDSGVIHIPRRDMKYNEYRREIQRQWFDLFPNMVWLNKPNQIYSEMLPITGGAAVQRVLGLGMVITCQTLALEKGIPWEEVSAITVKKRVTGSHKATKPKVRDAVIAVFPELQQRKKELTGIWEESDAIAIALTGAGYVID